MLEYIERINVSVLCVLECVFVGVNVSIIACVSTIARKHTCIYVEMVSVCTRACVSVSGCAFGCVIVCVWKC